MEWNKIETVSFIIPCYRSEKTIGSVINEIRHEINKYEGWAYEIICVDDNSPDCVFDVLKRLSEEDKNVRAIRFSKNFGQHAGLIAGIQHSVGDVCVLLDDDGQCPVDHLAELLSPLYEGWDIAIAQYGIKKQSIFKNAGSIFNEIMSNILIEKPRNIQMGNFMAFKRYIADELAAYAGPYPYISGLLFRTSAKVINVPMKERGRMLGETTYSIRKLVSLWLSSFTAFSIKPLRIATILGGGAATIGIIFAITIIIRKILNPAIPAGYSSTIAVNLILGGMILFVLGIIGEYIGRIYMSVNGTPQYVIKETINIVEKDEK